MADPAMAVDECVDVGQLNLGHWSACYVVPFIPLVRLVGLVKKQPQHPRVRVDLQAAHLVSGIRRSPDQACRFRALIAGEGSWSVELGWRAGLLGHGSS